MKKLRMFMLSVCLLAAILLALPVNAQAAEVAANGTCGESLSWTLDKEGTLIIFGTGAMEDSYNESPWSTYEVKNVIVQEGVTSIGSRAFYYCDELQSITIPDGVTVIGECAFFCCSSLVSINIPDSVTVIGTAAFAGCSSLKKATIHSGEIGFGAFQQCSSLTEVYIGSGATKIEEQAFFRCTNLKKVSFIKGVASIGKNAFSYCSSLTDIAIPNSVTSIGINAFSYCSSLTDIAIPNSVTSIENYAFHNCSNLRSVTIPNSVTSIGESAFSGCNSLNYNVYRELKYLGNNDNPYLVLMGSTVTDVEVCTVHYKTKFAGFSSFDNCFKIRKIYFTGNAPVFSGNLYSPNAIIIEYPANNETWTEEVLSESNWAVFWEAYDPISLEIITQPKTVYAADGGTAKTSVTVAGDGLTYQWYVKNAGASSYTKSSVKTASYACKMNSTTDGRYVRCKITDQYGDVVWTNTVRLKLKKLAITTQPVNKTVTDGKTAKFAVKATGLGLQYQWQYRTPSSGSWKNAKADGNKTKTLSVPASVFRHGYQYRCKITDSAGNKIYTKTVSLYVLGIKTQPVNKTVKAGTTAKFTVTAVGNGLTYQWQYRTSSSGNWKNASATGNKTKTLSVAATGAKHGYQYRCKITDSAGNTVYASVVNLYVLGIKTQPASKTVKAGATAQFTVKATGKGLTYQWQYRTSSSGSWKNVSTISGKTANYSLTAAARHNGYQYRCKITDSAGNVIYTGIVKLTVK